MHPIASIQAIEPKSTHPLFGRAKYGWIVHFFHRGSLVVYFPTVEEAERYYVYLGRNVPGLQVIRREEQVFWWVSF